MNFSIFQKIVYLPLSTTETAIGCILAYHVQKDGNSCFPSYDTINKETGASNKTISKVIRTFVEVGIFEFKHRGEIGTDKKAGGKLSNEYFFIFNGIKFYRNKLSSKAEREKFKSHIKRARKKAIADMEEDSLNRKQKNKSVIPSQMLRNNKPQNVNNDVCNVEGLKGQTIPSHFTPKPSQKLRRSIKSNVPEATSNTTKDTTSQPCNKKRTVWQDEQSSSILNNEQAPKNDTASNKYLSEQTHDEWLERYENG